MATPAVVPPSTSTRPSILVVDDDPLVLSLLQVVLHQRGFEVRAASSGEAAIELHRQHHASTTLALLDISMPGLDGPQTLAELRRFDPGLRVCFMSGHAGPYSAEDLLSQGMLRFFEKPFAIGTLADELWRLAQQEIRQPA